MSVNLFLRFAQQIRLLGGWCSFYAPILYSLYSGMIPRVTGVKPYCMHCIHTVTFGLNQGP